MKKMKKKLEEVLQISEIDKIISDNTETVKKKREFIQSEIESLEKDFKTNGTFVDLYGNGDLKSKKEYHIRQYVNNGELAVIYARILLAYQSGKAFNEITLNQNSDELLIGGQKFGEGYSLADWQNDIRVQVRLNELRNNKAATYAIENECSKLHSREYNTIQALKDLNDRISKL